MAESVEVEDGLLDIPQPDNSMSPAEGPLAHSAPTLTIDELLSTRLETVTLEQISGCLSSRPAAEIPEICLKLLKRDMEDAGKAKGMLRIGILGSQASSNALEGKIQKENLTYTTDEDLGKILDSISEDERRSLRTHAELLSLEWKLEAWTAFAPYAAGPTSDEYVNGSSRPTEVVPVLDENEDADVELDDPWETNEETMDDIDDPWKDAGSDVGSEGKQAVRAITEPTQGSPQRGDDTEEPPLSLSAFLHQSIIQSALDFASTAYLTGLSVLRSRYPEILFPIRTVLVEACPDWVSPNELAIAGLLPVLGGDGNEVGWPGQDQTKSSLLAERLCALMVTNTLPSLVHGSKEFMASGEIEEWYTSHILSLDQSGLVDVQLAWVQQAESTGITGLDELGEDLSLLSRLVYESNLSTEAYDRWALETWRNSSATDIISAYLSSSTPDTVVEDVNTRILPYLYVLEARAERSGQPDNTLIERYLCETILSLPLDLSLPIFESSKATLPKSDRIIKDDLNVARLALACLYGSDQRDVWGLMSAIFECLPVWELSGRNPEDDAELTSTTLESIATFIRPSASQPNPPRAADLMMFFRPLPFASLSRALDILDVHLESGEILARWDVPVQLRFLLQSSRDGKEQAELAEKMVRRATASGVRAGLRGAEKTRLGGRDGGEEAKWARLWDDMLRLNGSGDQLLRGAFGMVDGEELMRVYLGGLIRSGSETLTLAFWVAKIGSA